MASRNRRDQGPSTRDLIAWLQKNDPTGNARVMRFAPKAGYDSVYPSEFQVGEVVLDTKRTRRNGVGEHLAVEDYRHRFPHGRKKPVRVIVLPAACLDEPGSA